MANIFYFILQCFYFILPAYFANMAPVIVKKINILKIPLDFNKTLKNKPIFGKNKTFRGLIFGVVFSTIITYMQFQLYNMDFFKNLSLLNYSNWLLFGILIGFGALIGDLVKSFIKRRIGIAPGNRFLPWDQTDFIFGAFLFTYFLVKPSIAVIATTLLLSFVLHITVNHIAFYLHIRDEKW